MNRIIWIGAAMAVLGVLGAGCGANACEAAEDEYSAHYESCGNPLPATTATSTPCTDEEADLARCLTDCYTAASCELINGTGTVAEANVYNACRAACSN